MKTTSFKIAIKRQTRELDAADQSVGRLASQIALLLCGKNKIDYTPNIDNGDFVRVINADKLKFTGKKLMQNKYYRHSNHPGGLKETKLKDLVVTKPGEVIKKAVYRMLPKNRLREERIKRLIIK